jgi:pimeloyl-ACP methyl ester carboxylesterase
MRGLLLGLVFLLCACSSAPRVPSPVPTARVTVLFLSDLAAPPEVWDTTRAHLAHLVHLGGGVESRVVGAASAADLAKYIREEHLWRPVLVGHMFGGTVAWWLAMEHPDLVGGIVTVDAPPSRNTGDRDLAELKDECRAIGEATPERFARMMKHRLASQMNDKARAEALAAKAASADPRVVADQMYRMMAADTRSSIRRIDAPALALLTTGNLPDGSTSEVEALYRDQLAPIPQHELVVVKGSHHYVMFDAPDVFFAALDRFLGTRGSGYGQSPHAPSEHADPP